MKSVVGGGLSKRFVLMEGTDRLVVLVGNQETQSDVDKALAYGAHDCLASSELQTDLLGYALRHAVERAQRGRGARERAAELRLLFDFNPHPMWMFDAMTLKFIAVNQVAISAYGFSEKEFLAMSVADLRTVGSGANERVGSQSPAQDASGIWRHRRKSRGEIEVEVFVQAVPQWGRDVCLAQTRAVTAARRAVLTHKRSVKRFRDFFTPMSVFLSHPQLDHTLPPLQPAPGPKVPRRGAGAVGATRLVPVGTEVARWPP